MKIIFIFFHKNIFIDIYTVPINYDFRNLSLNSKKIALFDFVNISSLQKTSSFL